MKLSRDDISRKLEHYVNTESLDLVCCWLSEVRSGGLSSNTICAYLSDIVSFFSFLSRHFGAVVTIALLSELKIKDFRSWLSNRWQDGLSSRSNTRAISVLRHFYKYFNRNSNYYNDTVYSLQFPRVSAVLPKYATNHDYNVLVQYIEEHHKNLWESYRDIAIITLLYGCGLRISECLAIKKKEFVNNQKFVIIKGKGDKERVVPALPTVVEKISQYLDICPYYINYGETIFRSSRGKNLSRNYVANMIQKLRNKLGLSNHISPHSFRHSFATDILRNGAKIRSVQQLLGHSNLSTTQQYTKLNISDIKRQYDKLHPMSE